MSSSFPSSRLVSPAGAGSSSPAPPGETSLLAAFKKLEIDQETGKPNLFLPSADECATALVAVAERWSLAHRYQWSSWAEAWNYCFGDQYGTFSFDAPNLWKPRDPVPEKKLTRVSLNHMRGIIGDVAGLQVQDPPNFRCAPSTDSSAAASASKTADQLVWYLWQQDDYDTKNYKLREAAGCVGNAFLYPIWDPTGGEEAEVVVGIEPIPGPPDPLTGLPSSMGMKPVMGKKRVGCFADRIVSTYDALPDPAATDDWDGEGFIIHEMLPIASLRDLYPDFRDAFVAEEPSGANEGSFYSDQTKGIAPRTSGVYSGAAAAREAERTSVYTIFLRTCSDFYRGRRAVVAHGKLVYCGDNPVYPSAREEEKGEVFPNYHWPVFRFGHNSVTGSYWYQGVATFIIDPQKKLNGVASKKLHMLKRTSHPVLVKPKRADFIKSDEPDQQINVSDTLAPGSIYYLQSPVFPQELQLEERLSVEQMESIAGIHASTRGASEQGNSGIKDRMLFQKDLGRLAIPKRHNDRVLAMAFSYKLREWRRNATIARTIRVVGENNVVSVRQFDMASIAPGIDVEVYDDVTLPRDPSARILHVEKMIQMGILVPAEDPALRAELAEALGFGGAIRKFESGVVADKRLADDENLRMYDGEQPVVEFWHDDAQHLAALYGEMNTMKWITATTPTQQDAPEVAQRKMMIREAYLAHAQAHQAQAEQKAQAQAQPAAQDTPKKSIPFGELPPGGKVQMAAQAGINLSPEEIAQQDAMEREAKAQEAQMRFAAQGGPKVGLSGAPPVPNASDRPPAQKAA